MAYAVKYRIQYKRISNSTTTIDILQDGYTGGTITELEPTDKPLEISFDGDINNIYMPTIGSGAVINFYTTPLTLLDLFTENPQEFIVKIYNGASGSNLFWQGFVNTDIYSEDYSAANTTLISLQCNDGMATLDKIPFYNSNSDVYYTGTTAITYILSTILNKLNITFTDIYTSNDLRIADYVTNFFYYLNIPQENFVDENGNPFSCRKVLDSIIGGIGLVMKFKGSNIYFIDPINLHSPSKGKHYDLTPIIGYGESQSNVGGYVDISGSTLSWFETGSRLDIIPSKDIITVKYDPYNFEGSKYVFSNSRNWNTSGTFINRTGYYTNTGVTYNGWVNNSYLKYNGYAIKESATSVPEYGLYIGSSHVYMPYYSYVFPFSNIVQDQNLALKIKMKVYVNTHTSENIYAEETETDIHMVRIPIKVKVGNQYYNDGISWITGFTYTYIDVVEEPYNLYYYLGSSHVNDKWNEAYKIIPLGQSTEENLINGNVELTIIDNYYNIFGNYYTVYPLEDEFNVHNLIIKDVEIEIININTGERIGNEGINTYVSKLSKVVDKKLEHNLTSGTGTFGCSRGAYKTIMQPLVGTNISGLIRSTGSTGGTKYSTQQLVLQNLYSQYNEPRFRLTGVLDVKNYLLNMDLLLVKDNRYLTNKSFYIVSGTYNDVNESMDVDMIELSNNREEIV